jgi:L-rhamnose mutarotase
VNRYCFVSRVRPELLDEYRARHAAVWPDMLRALRAAGWHNYSIFCQPDGLLVFYVEADDLDAASAAMAATEVNTRWQREMDGYFVPGETRFVTLDRIFTLDEQLDRIDQRGESVR